MTIQDGTETFKGDQVTGDKLDVTVGWHGTVLPTNPTNEIPTNGIFLLTATDGGNDPGWYENTGTVSAPVFTKRLSAGADPDPFGDGIDGADTNPTYSPTAAVPVIKSLTNLTISANVTWAGTGLIFIRVNGTFDLQAGFTITIDTNSEAAVGAKGDASAANIGDGGAGGLSRSTVIIIAKSIIGTGTITSTGVVGVAGVKPAGEENAQENSAPGGDSTGKHYIGDLISKGAPGVFSQAGGVNTSTEITDLDPVKDLKDTRDIVVSSGAGGASGEKFSTGLAGPGGGGGGGGAAVFLVLITDGALPAITITLTGGVGGVGGDQNTEPSTTANGQGGGGGAGGSTPLIRGGAGGSGAGSTFNDGGGGGGGGAASVFKIGTSDGTTTTLTGGAGGAGGSLSGGAGIIGGTKDFFDTWDDFVVFLTRGL